MCVLDAGTTLLQRDTSDTSDNVMSKRDKCSPHSSPPIVLRIGAIMLLLLRCIKRWLGDHTSCCVCKADMEEMAKAVRKPPRRRRSREFCKHIPFRGDAPVLARELGP